MPTIDLASIIQNLTDYLVLLGQDINELPGGMAFALGLFSWFVVEQVLRRILSWVRWLILAGVIAGLGLTIPYVVNEFFSRAGTPQIDGLDLSPDLLLPKTDA